MRDRLAFSPEELAGALGVSRSTINVMLRDGYVAHTRIGTRILIPAAEVDRMLAGGGQR